jgi:membrane-associated phospholipid phosphatase
VLQGRYLWENLGEDSVVALLVGLVVWCTIVIYSRMYLGMHSPVDVTCGVLVAAVLVVFWISCDVFLDAWMTQVRHFGFSFSLLLPALF